MKAYSIGHWGTHPDEGNDDCYTGEDFDTKEEALAAFEKGSPDYSVQFIEVDGPDVHDVRLNAAYNARQVLRDRDGSDDRREAAMQAGMAFGCDGYNDEMNW